MPKKKKAKFEGKTTCPYCKKALIIRVHEETIKPSVPAEKVQRLEAEKDTQSKLKGG